MRYVITTKTEEFELPQSLGKHFKQNGFLVHYRSSTPESDIIWKLYQQDDNFALRVYDGDKPMDGGLYSVEMDIINSLCTATFNHAGSLPDSSLEH